MSFFREWVGSRIKAEFNWRYHAVLTGCNDVYIVDVHEVRGDKMLVSSACQPEPFEIEAGILSYFRKFNTSQLRHQLLIYPYVGSGALPEGTFKSCYPLAYNYLDSHRALLKNGDWALDIWYCYEQMLRDIGDWMFDDFETVYPVSALNINFYIDEDRDGSINFHGIFMEVLANNRRNEGTKKPSQKIYQIPIGLCSPLGVDQLIREFGRLWSVPADHRIRARRATKMLIKVLRDGQPHEIDPMETMRKLYVELKENEEKLMHSTDRGVD